ncbi:uncharacterized protein LOC109841717 [Asparagus officinalis]|uniref:uncharacterized protein LOC109841717 n=1 Tax=Asparagus officinalis TaxID=4686 RepID=UPI00098E1512|nr:uncharacterized protein LOC109841717 [Asparagus officinalis]
MTTNLAENGIDDWHNLPTKLREHESNPEHCANVVKWVDLQKGLKLKATIDKDIEAQIDKEKTRWKMILVRIIAVVTTLSRNGLPFRGTNEKIYEKNNGLFCQLIEFLAEFDPIMQDHVRRVVDKEVQNHYLSYKIQNELIILLANEIKEKILDKISKAKYFSVILDCTPDLSHEEKMSIIIRCVDIEDTNQVKVEEFFLGFIKVDDMWGLGLFNQLEDTLNKLNLNIDDIRGQGYNNGSNMKGLHFVCWINTSGDVLKTYVKGLTPKPLSVTRWESHVKSVKAIRYQALELGDALIEIVNSSKEDIVMAEAKGLCKNALEDFEFLISLCFWYKILDKVNRVSKILQQEEMNLEDAITRINELIVFFQKFREDGFENMMKEANELANDVGIDPTFPIKRVVRRKKHFDEDVEANVEGSQSPEDNFRVSYFLHIIDQALTSLKYRFEQFELYEEIFDFLFNAKFMSIGEEKLMEHCIKLQRYLEHNKQCDIHGKDLFNDLRALQTILPKEVTKSIDILDFIRSY